MLKKSSTYHSGLYRDFKMINRRDYRSIVDFYEMHEMSIEELPFEEYFFMLKHYSYSLFALERFQRHLAVVDKIIELSIFNNIQNHDGEDVYIKSLNQKASSLYYLQRFTEAQHILNELIKLDPTHTPYIKLFKYCLSYTHTPHWKLIQTVGIFILLLTTGLAVIKLLVINNWWVAYETLAFDFLRWSFNIGSLLTVVGVVLHFSAINRQANQIKQKAIRRKKEKAKIKQ